MTTTAAKTPSMLVPDSPASREPTHSPSSGAPTKPGLVPVGSAVGAHDGLKLAARQRPDVVLLDPQLLDADGLGTCRRLRALDPAPRVVLYSAGGDPNLPVTARVAGADGLVDKAAPAEELFEAIRRVARGQTALPPLDREQVDAAAHRVEAEDLALLAMLMDRTEPSDVAATLRSTLGQ